MTQSAQTPITPVQGSGGFSLPPFNERLHQEWSEFLGRVPWQWFATFTFKVEIHPEAADKLYRVWINKLNRAIYGQRWAKHPPFGCIHARALEWQKRGVLHYHSLIANIGYEDRDHWAEVWRELGQDTKAGFIKIDLYDPNKGGVESYLSKYVAKGGELDISANMQRKPFIKKLPSNVDQDRNRKLAGV